MTMWKRALIVIIGLIGGACCAIFIMPTRPANCITDERNRDITGFVLEHTAQIELAWMELAATAASTGVIARDYPAGAPFLGRIVRIARDANGHWYARLAGTSDGATFGILKRRIWSRRELEHTSRDEQLRLGDGLGIPDHFRTIVQEWQIWQVGGPSKAPPQAPPPAAATEDGLPPAE